MIIFVTEKKTEGDKSATDKTLVKRVNGGPLGQRRKPQDQYRSRLKMSELKVS